MRGKALMAIVEGIILMIVGMYTLFVNLSIYLDNEHFISSADKVVAECVKRGDGTDSDTSYLKSIVKFEYNGKEYQNVIVDTYGQNIIPGDKMDLYVKPENPNNCVIKYSFYEGKGKILLFFTLLGLGAGMLAIFIGIMRKGTGNYW